MLASDKVFLAALTPEDAAQMFVWANDVDIARLNGPYRPVDLMNHNALYANIGKDQSKVVFAVRKQDDRRFVGYVQISNINAVFRSAELGLVIGHTTDRGKGYGFEALRLAMTFCRDDLNLRRLSMFICGENPAAIRAYEKAGFTVEGVMKEAAFVGGRYADITIMGYVGE